MLGNRDRGPTKRTTVRTAIEAIGQIVVNGEGTDCIIVDPLLNPGSTFSYKEFMRSYRGNLDTLLAEIAQETSIKIRTDTEARLLAVAQKVVLAGLSATRATILIATQDVGTVKRMSLNKIAHGDKARVFMFDADGVTAKRLISPFERDA
ncbi:MAG: hypothetical protein WC846_05575 [Candidatus Gracilibacteria bacterium]